jgi:hypothetical protein
MDIQRTGQSFDADTIRPGCRLMKDSVPCLSISARHASLPWNDRQQTAVRIAFSFATACLTEWLEQILISRWGVIAERADLSRPDGPAVDPYLNTFLVAA